MSKAAQDWLTEDHAVTDVPKHVVVLCHPEETSFNMSVAREYCSAVAAHGHEAVLRDLYRMGFDPVLKAQEQPQSPRYVRSADVSDEMAVIAGASVYVLVYPIWFGTPPAMLKGYVERVFGTGFSHRDVRERAAHALLRGQHLLSFTSSGTTKQWLDQEGAWQSLRNVFDFYLEKAFSMKSSEHIHFASIVEGLAEQFVQENLEEVRMAARKICSIVGSERYRGSGTQGSDVDKFSGPPVD